MVSEYVEVLRTLPAPQPVIGDDVARWLPCRTVRALHSSGIVTLADLTVRVPRRRRWWAGIPGLGRSGAKQVERFFASHPELTERARALIAREQPLDIAPWERAHIPATLDGSQGALRAPAVGSSLRAKNDYEAVQAWLELQESPSTQRAYRKEAERLMLWAIFERGVALSSLTTEDALAYRSFLRQPTPQARWVGPSQPRSSVDWKPFTGALSARSTGYAISVLSSVFRWLVEQRYVLANPFSGVKVRGAGTQRPLDATRAFTEVEWDLILAVADAVEWSYGWSEAAAQRLRFLLTFIYATGLRAGEFVNATLGGVVVDHHGDQWLALVGKGAKKGRVALPPMALAALDAYLAQRGLPTTRSRWQPKTPLVAGLLEDAGQAITAGRLWSVMKRFFLLAAKVVEGDSPATAEKLRSATTHWMRHTHATHALSRGVELLTVRDNLRHASISTTSNYLHGDDAQRARQIGKAFGSKSK